MAAADRSAHGYRGRAGQSRRISVATADGQSESLEILTHKGLLRGEVLR
jgi:hypothetical protein